jgi:hypothetical protein
MSKAWKVPKADCALIRKLDRSNVSQTLAKLDRYISNARWLAKTNRYAVNTIDRLALDNTPTNAIQPQDLAQYIAASAVLHCADGWSYLGRAINCLLKGDPHRVVHLAYYAELRAALSLLASEGIGVFNSIHFLIDGPDSARRLPARPRTHVAAWSYLKYWGGLKRSGEIFSEIVTPSGISLAEWFDPIGGVAKFVRPKAREWFSQWSMDLALFTEDRDARNDSSYRPDGIPVAWSISAPTALELASELWEVCEPSSTSLFDGIDRHILRMTIESAFKGTYNVLPAQDYSRFTTFIASIIDPLGLDVAITDEWKRFLRREITPSDPKIFEYSAGDPLDKSVGHLAIIARAVLLLRVATGSVLNLIRSAGVSGQQLEFWWSQLGINRGLWDGSKRRADLMDLWDDITILLQDVQTFRNNTPLGQQTFQLIDDKIPQVISGFGGCERVAIWSLTR